MKHTLIGLCFIGLSLVGCKSDDNPANPSGGGITAFPGNAVTVTSGGTSAARLTGGTAPYTIATAPNSAVATARISADTLYVTAVASGSTSLVIRDAAATPAMLTISITVPVSSTITVSGTVVDFFNQPINGAAVVVKGKAAVTTNSSGGFTVTNVTTPYDISMVIGSQKLAIVYQGLTRPDPTLVYTFGAFGTSNSATISGTVPAAAGRTTRVVFVSGDEQGSTTANQTTGAYNFSVSWFSSAASLSGMIHVVRYTTGTNNLPSSYDAFGSQPLTISDGGTFANNNFTAGQLTDPVDQNISGTVSLPASYSLSFRQLYIHFGPSPIFIGSEGGTLGNNLSYTVPSISGATYSIYTNANSGSRSAFFFKSNIAAGTSGLSIPLEAAPQLSLPVNNGTNVDTATSFLFTQGGGSGVNVVTIVPNSSADPTFLIFTSQNMTSIPNLSAQGLGLPSNRNYTWRAQQVFPLASVDAAASGSYVNIQQGRSGDFGQGFSESFSFTTR